MPAQDDVRERHMAALFNLTVLPDRKRGDVDAHLHLPDGSVLDFELKSTTTGKSISTVRDFGPRHVEKWRNMHWLFGIFDDHSVNMIRCHYASPAHMQQWVDAQVDYAQPDIILGKYAPLGVTMESVHELFGDREFYTRKEAESVMKRNWSVSQYAAASDHPDGYSGTAMLEIMRARCEYVMSRGATRNNPHIEAWRIRQFPEISAEHAQTLRSLTRQFLQTAADTEQATA
ncbi:hypothetical protein OU787_12815 [Kitasatospora sp. YST-16]|uniref:hypothetical protein n=1 Tax=Kitasatospora sp. YST-16 TaxID=2998080 RepID=UPI002284A0DC|nr:hypothetical protein [Kitasatospora sp. YST-16]WAL72307.1 hypothetical protein OU787_12815 [Kitasatospora sp. YST-16]WNW38354.1 hypothetical protein RKE32_12780 [Streptomyces sp. Li-HN-5-13]